MVLSWFELSFPLQHVMSFSRRMAWLIREGVSDAASPRADLADLGRNLLASLVKRGIGIRQTPHPAKG
jgi:hypothetical protein